MTPKQPPTFRALPDESSLEASEKISHGHAMRRIGARTAVLPRRQRRKAVVAGGATAAARVRAAKAASTQAHPNPTPDPLQFHWPVQPHGRALGPSIGALHIRHIVAVAGARARARAARATAGRAAAAAAEPATPSRRYRFVPAFAHVMLYGTRAVVVSSVLWRSVCADRLAS